MGRNLILTGFFKENGGTGRTRTADRDFADLGLTTWRRCPALDKTMKMEREKGFEPSTSTLARLHSTTELLPRSFRFSGIFGVSKQPIIFPQFRLSNPIFSKTSLQFPGRYGLYFRDAFAE